jgi:hypothetical protein
MTLRKDARKLTVVLPATNVALVPYQVASSAQKHVQHVLVDSETAASEGTYEYYT